MAETVEDLTRGFKISVANCFAAAKDLLPELQRNAGSILITGGGTANYPNPAMATISLGKAGVRNLALQLHQACKSVGVFAGTVTINGAIDPASAVHNPDSLAEKFWQLNQRRDQAEVTV
jgi:short-subunit dehydrogenase